MQLADIVLRNAQERPDATAVVDGAARWSYAELVQQAARYLRLLESAPGDGPAAVLLGGRNEYAALYLASICSRRTLVPLNHRLSRTEQLLMLVDSGAELLFTDRAGAESAAWLSAASPCRPSIHVIEEVALDPPIPFHCFEHDVASRVAAFYTLGGRESALGALITHGNLGSTVAALRERAPQLGPDDVFLAATSPWHVYTLVASILLPLTLGARVVLCAHPDPLEMARLIERERVTFIAAAPSILRSLSECPDGWDSSSLRFAVSGGDLLAPEIRAAFERRFGAPVVEGYGCTEACAAVASNPFGEGRRSGTAGLPLGNQRVVIVDDRGSRMPPGDVGEVLVRGSNIMAGYLGRPDETLRVLRDGWLYTGDLAWSDAQGYLHLVGRKQDVIVVDGLTVYPTLVEEVIGALEGVRECAVIAVRHPDLGQAPKAVIVVEPDASLDERDVARHCAAHLAEYEVPKGFAFVRELPRTTSGRISRATVRQIYGRGGC